MTVTTRHRHARFARRRQLEVRLLLLVAFLLSAATIATTAVFPHSLRFGWVLVLTTLVLIPSYGLARWLALGSGHLDTLLLGLPLAFGVHLPLFAVAASLHWTPNLWIELASVLAFVVFALTATSRGEQADRPPPRVSIAAGLLILMVTVALIAALSGRDSDDWAYGAYLADTADNLPLMAGDPVLGPDIPTFPRQSLNLWLGILGAGARATSVSVPVMLQDHLPSALAALAVAAAFLLGRTLGRRPTWGLVTAGVLVLWMVATPYHSEPGNGLFYRISEDKYAAMLLLGPLVFSGMMKLLDQSDRRTGIFGVLAGVGMASVHPFTYVIVLAGLWGWVVSLVLTREASWRNAVRGAFGFTTAAVIPVLVDLRLSEIGPGPGTTPYIEILKSQFENNTNRLWIRGARVVMVHPDTILDPLTLAMPALAIVAPFWKANRRTLLPAALTLTVLLSVFNPLVAPVMARTLGVGVIWRFTWLLPVPYAVAAWAAALEPLPARSRRLLVLVALLAVVAVQLPAAQGAWTYWDRTRAIWRYEPELVPLYQAIASTGTDGYVLAPNLPVGVKIPSFAPRVKLVAFRGAQGTIGHMPQARISEGVQRVRDLESFYTVTNSNTAPSNDDFDILDRYDIRLLVLGESDPRLGFFATHTRILSHDGHWYLFTLPNIGELKAAVDQTE